MFATNWRTAESVTEGHPDKICDQISDAILDAYLTADPLSRVAVEAVGGHGTLFIVGEATSKAEVDAAKIAQEVYRSIGYGDKLAITVKIVAQSPDIAQGVDTGGAGDQGIMYGYATNETKEMLPRPVVLAHQLTNQLTNLRKHDPDFAWLRPDGKAQVTTVEDKVGAIVISTQHDQSITTEELRKQLYKHVIKPVVPEISADLCLINQTGIFIQGGFEADTGLTGRKIMVDTYGGLIPQGGGCFSGKDPTKVDRSAAYMARYLAKQVINNGWANVCLVSLAYAIGHVEPVMVDVWTDTNYPARQWVLKNFDLSPSGIINFLNLRQPIYRPTAVNGHFSHRDFPWEQLSKVKKVHRVAVKK